MLREMKVGLLLDLCGSQARKVRKVPLMLISVKQVLVHAYQLQGPKEFAYHSSSTSP